VTRLELASPLVCVGLALGSSLLLPSLAFAGPGEGEASVGVSASTQDGAEADADADSDADSDSDERWIDRHAPEPMMAEIGIWGGVLFPSPTLELFEAELGLPGQGRKQYGILAPDVGVRVG
jgi:hypothetical protein